MSLMKFNVAISTYLGNEVSLEWRSQNVTTEERSLPGIVKPLLWLQSEGSLDSFMKWKF